MRNIIVFFLFVGYSCCAQDFYIVPSAFYSTYSLKDMRDSQDSFVQTSGDIGVKAVTSFPAFVGFGAELGWHPLDSSYSVGAYIGYNSTGGRADYQDYSGKLRYDQLLHCYLVGAVFKTMINKSSAWRLFASASVLYVRSNLKLSTNLEVGASQQSQDYSFVSGDVGILPALILQHPFNKRIFLQASAGYEIDVPVSKVYVPGNKHAWLTNNNGDDVHIRWDGIRAGLGIGIYLTREEDEK